MSDDEESESEYIKFQEARNKQMFNEMYKETKKADFNVENYDIEELAAILNFKYVPLNKGIIKERINELKNKFKDYDNYVDFFNNVEIKLLNNLNLHNKETWMDAYKNDDSDASKVLKNQFRELNEKDKKEKNNQMLDIAHVVIGQRKLSSTERQMQKNFVQGSLNNIKKDTYTRLINFDSRVRQILPRVSYSCGGGTVSVTETNSEGRLYTATNYIAHLTEPLTNVVSIEVDKVTIPKNWYVFSENYGTTSFQIHSRRINNGGVITIEIGEGNYSNIDLITAINNRINATELNSLLEFSYSSNDRKVNINNKDTAYDISLNWYIPEIAGSCGGNGAGSKVDYNLGWLLGFRNTSTFIQKNKAKVGQGTVNTTGTNYLFVTLDDFNNNKPSNVVISAGEPITSGYKLPSYYNDETMNPSFGAGTFYPGRENEAGFECVDVADENNNERGCATNDLNIDLRNNLTLNQIYSINQLKQAQSESSADRYGSPEPTDLLYTINDLGRVDWGDTLSYENREGENKREYFGPVKLTKFKIRLVNDKGYDVDLNGGDWQFTLKVTQKYQY